MTTIPGRMIIISQDINRLFHAAVQVCFGTRDLAQISNGFFHVSLERDQTKV